MGYDVEFLQIDAGDCRFPVEAATASRLVQQAMPFPDPEKVKDALLQIGGTKAGPAGSVDYLGAGLNYARLHVNAAAVRVDNNLNSKELLKIYTVLRGLCPRLLILDLQNGNLHDAESFAAWWNKPL